MLHLPWPGHSVGQGCPQSSKQSRQRSGRALKFNAWASETFSTVTYVLVAARAALRGRTPNAMQTRHPSSITAR